MTKRLLTWILLGTLTQGLGAAEVITASAGLGLPSVQEAGAARAIAMGSTYVGIAEGSASLLWNPAGLGSLERAEIALHHNTALLGAFQEIAVIAFPLSDNNGLGLSLTYEDNGVFEGRDSLGTATGDYSARAYGASLGWGFGGPGGLAMGLAIKATGRDLAGVSETLLAGDIGVLWKLRPEFNVGAAYTNIAAPDSNGRQLAQGLRVGVSSLLFKSESFQWLAAVSGESMSYGENSLHFGLEQVIQKILALRAGYAMNVPNPQSTGLVGWTFGAGIAFKDLSVDYAFVPLAELGNMQRVSLTYAFGQRREKAPAAKAAPAAAAAPKPLPTAVVVPAPTPATAAAAAPADASKSVETVVTLTDEDFNRVVPHGEAELITVAALGRLDRALAETAGDGAHLRVIGTTAMKPSLDAPLHIGSRRANLVRGYLVRKAPPARVIKLVPVDVKTVERSGLFQIVVR